MAWKEIGRQVKQARWIWQRSREESLDVLEMMQEEHLLEYRKGKDKKDRTKDKKELSKDKKEVSKERSKDKKERSKEKDDHKNT